MDPIKCGGIKQVSKEEWDSLVGDIQKEKDRLAEKMPDELAALIQMNEAFTRLKQLGFREACYCPKDGTMFDAIEAGSTGIHDCNYSGEWPKGYYHIYAHNDIWPSQPILFREKKK